MITSAFLVRLSVPVREVTLPTLDYSWGEKISSNGEGIAFKERRQQLASKTRRLQADDAVQWRAVAA